MFRGELPFPFDVVARTARHYGVAESWVLEGGGAPYAQHRPPHRDAGDLFRELIGKPPEEVSNMKFHVVLEDAGRGEATIFEECSDWRWNLIATGIPVHNDVGGGGESMLADLALFLAAADFRLVSYRCPQGYVCAPDDYRKIVSGDLHPVRVRLDGKYSHWVNDLWDIDYSGATNYSRSYSGARERLRERWAATDVTRGSTERITSNQLLRRHIEEGIAARRHA